jgi:hypothetical protein
VTTNAMGTPEDPRRALLVHYLAALGIVTMAALGVHAQAPHQYTSPDGKTVAVVGPVIGTKTNESEVHISDVAGAFSTFRLNHSFASADGEHGLVIVRSAWSPNSRYFVFSGESSGGHQPWHSPMFVYSRRTNALYELDACVPGIAVVAPDFELSSPQFARVTVDDLSVRDGLARKPRPETYDLAAVERDK